MLADYCQEHYLKLLPYCGSVTHMKLCMMRFSRCLNLLLPEVLKDCRYL